MQTRRERRHEDLFITVPLGELVPKDHILHRIDAVFDLGWLHDELRDCYCPDNGRPSIDHTHNGQGLLHEWGHNAGLSHTYPIKKGMPLRCSTQLYPTTIQLGLPCKQFLLINSETHNHNLPDL